MISLILFWIVSKYEKNVDGFIFFFTFMIDIAIIDTVLKIAEKMIK